jgi:hypothetical protein
MWFLPSADPDIDVSVFVRDATVAPAERPVKAPGRWFLQG